MGPFTYRDLLRHDEADDHPAELIGGEIVPQAGRRFAHAFSHAEIAAALCQPGRAVGDVWWITTSPDVLFGEDVLRPDLAAWRRDRLPELPDAGIDLAPEWVCEILSPGHVAHDRVTKAAIYADAGVPWYWVVDPHERLLEALRRHDDGRWIVHGTWQTGAARIPPFEPLLIDVDRLFAPRGPADPPIAKEPEARYRADR